MSYARLILCACTKDSLPEGLNKALPPRYSASPLIQHYLNHIFIILPLCDEASLYASVDAVYNPDPRKATAFDHWTVRMILAIASVSVSNQRGDSSYLDGIGHVSAALHHAEDVLHPGSIPSIQAVLLLVEYAMFDPHHFDSWTLIGVASRAMVDLGIHQDPSKASVMPKAKLELRRRVYYCVYALDRFAIPLLVGVNVAYTRTDLQRLYKPERFHFPMTRPTSLFPSRPLPCNLLKAHQKPKHGFNLMSLLSITFVCDNCSPNGTLNFSSPDERHGKIHTHAFGELTRR